jgi:hypothetical protein
MEHLDGLEHHGNLPKGFRVTFRCFFATNINRITAATSEHTSKTLPVFNDST